MKKSVSVPATLVMAMATNLALVGCSNSSCVDSAGNVAPEVNCSQSRSGFHYVPSTTRGGFGGGSASGGSSFGG